MIGKQCIVYFLIMVGFYQLFYICIFLYVVLVEMVEGVVVIKCLQFKGLINGVLCQFQCQQEVLLVEFVEYENCYFYFKWLLKCLQQVWLEQWQEIVEVNNQCLLMWLCVNCNYYFWDEWFVLFNEVGLEGFIYFDYLDVVCLVIFVLVYVLSGFDEGWVIVQDVLVQGCMCYLQLKNGECIFDFCVVLGGKMMYILEVVFQFQVMVVDIDEQCLFCVYDNLKWLGMKVEVKQGDGCFFEQWCGNEQFDCILLDVFCFVIGVICCYLDIKWLCWDWDIVELVQLQVEIFNVIWVYLKSGGMLVYVICFILLEENGQ